METARPNVHFAIVEGGAVMQKHRAESGLELLWDGCRPPFTMARAALSYRRLTRMRLSRCLRAVGETLDEIDALLGGDASRKVARRLCLAKRTLGNWKGLVSY